MQINQKGNGSFGETIKEIRLVMNTATLKGAVDGLNQQVERGEVYLTPDQWATFTCEVLARKRELEAREDSHVPYQAYKLGNTAYEVLKAFYAHPGEMGMTPHGFDVYQGFEFFAGSDNKLYKKLGIAMEEVSNREEERLFWNVSAGVVEFYLRRPMLGVAPFCLTQKKLLHAATGQPIPAE
jgi:hypothetical protein